MAATFPTETLDVMGAKNPRYGYDANGKILYIGEAEPGIAESEPGWRIKEFLYDDSLRVIGSNFAGGAATFVNKWTDRASLTYS